MQYYVFTFHYASTLSYFAEPYSLHHCNIYIPLCFYFIVVLSYPSSENLLIYIPLCFYFI